MLKIFRRATLIEICFLEMAFALEGVSVCWAWVNPGCETGNLNGWTTSSGTGANPTCQPYAMAVGPGPAPHTQGTICVAPTICLNQVYAGSFSAQLDSC